METNPTVLFTGTRQVAIENRPMPAVGPGEMLIRTRCTLISTGTELTILAGDYPPGTAWSKYAKFPFLAGYDNIGEVVDAGSSVDKSWLGRTVATYCNHARFVKAAPANARPVVRDIPDRHAVFFTIAEIVMNGVRRGGITWGETVIVYGMGLLGQLTARICRNAGATRVFCTDTAPARLAMLPNCAAFVPVNAATDDIIAIVREATRGRMADAVFEVTGNPAVIPSEFAAVRRCGRMILLSSPKGLTLFDFHDLCNAPSYTIIGAHNFSHPEAATSVNPWTQHRHGELFFDMVADGDLDIEPLISHRRPYTDAVRLYQMLLDDRSSAMGVVMEWG